MPRLLFVFGTRAEATKLVPVVRAARQRAGEFRTRVCVTGQHREMLDGVLQPWGLRPDVDLDLMSAGQTLSGLAGRMLLGLDPVLAREKPDWVVVQGDTTTAMAASWAAFHRRVPVAHVEAGLRTGDPGDPFPEEMNRVVVSRLASLHLAPTEGAAANLRREGVAADRVVVTGNPGIDALLEARDGPARMVDVASRFPVTAGRRVVVATVHRRENQGPRLEALCDALGRLLREHPDVAVVWPVHRNPAVHGPVRRLMEPALATGRLAVEGPLDHPTFVALLMASSLVLTDSGGVQEEAPALGKPVLCLRESTERPEGVEAGAVRLVGTDPDRIVREAASLLGDPAAYARMAVPASPYGDGHAASRILDALAAAAPSRPAGA